LFATRTNHPLPQGERVFRGYGYDDRLRSSKNRWRARLARPFAPSAIRNRITRNQRPGRRFIPVIPLAAEVAVKLSAPPPPPPEPGPESNPPPPPEPTPSPEP